MAATEEFLQGEGLVPFPLAIPQLVILEQTPISEFESTKHVHTVVKNIPFEIHFGFGQESSHSPVPLLSTDGIDFNDIEFYSQLLYDTPELKEVSSLGTKPFEVRRILKKDTKRVEMQFRIKILSSHHENLCFIFQIQARNPPQSLSTSVLPSLTVYSHPIRVISKPEKKKIPKPPLPKRKKVQERIFDQVNQIQQQILLQEAALTSLSQYIKKGDHVPSTTLTQDLEALPSLSTEVPFVPPLTIDNTQGFQYWDEEEDSNETTTGNMATRELLFSQLGDQTFVNDPSGFNIAMKRFINLYETMGFDQKHDSIRKLLRSSTKAESDLLASFIAILNKDGIEYCAKNVGCTCNFCPYELQLTQIKLDSALDTFPVDTSVSSFSLYP